jgi:hypothetical protein
MAILQKTFSMNAAVRLCAHRTRLSTSPLSAIHPAQSITIVFDIVDFVRNLAGYAGASDAVLGGYRP